MLLKNQYHVLKFISRRSYSLILLPHTLKIKCCYHVTLLTVVCVRMSWNPKLWIFERCLLFTLQSCSCLFSPLCGNVQHETRRICRQQISVQITIKKKSVSRFCGYWSLFNGSHSWQTTNPDQIHKTVTSQKQRRKSMHSHLRVFWGYDTVMIR